MINYFLKERGEQICRSTVAPNNFQPGQKLFSYIDSSDSEYNNIYVSNEPMKIKKANNYNLPSYAACKEELAEAETPSATRAVASESEKSKKTKKNLDADYDNNAVPFSF